MFVELSNGTVIEDVPSGTSQLELLVKLKKAGIPIPEAELNAVKEKFGNFTETSQDVPTQLSKGFQSGLLSLGGLVNPNPIIPDILKPHLSVVPDRDIDTTAGQIGQFVGGALPALAVPIPGIPAAVAGRLLAKGGTSLTRKLISKPGGLLGGLMGGLLGDLPGALSGAAGGSLLAGLVARYAAKRIPAETFLNAAARTGIGIEKGTAFLGRAGLATGLGTSAVLNDTTPSFSSALNTSEAKQRGINEKNLTRQSDIETLKNVAGQTYNPVNIIKSSVDNAANPSFSDLARLISMQENRAPALAVIKKLNPVRQIK